MVASEHAADQHGDAGPGLRMPDQSAGKYSMTSKEACTQEAWDSFFKLKQLDQGASALKKIAYFASMAVDVPVSWFRQNVVEKAREANKQTYYHRANRRAKYVDECEVKDFPCVLEANHQLLRDKKVDREIMRILRQRVAHCERYFHHPFGMFHCVPLREDMEEAELNYFIKYGELGRTGNAIYVYMKQKHRYIWERRNPDILEQRRLDLEAHKKEVAQGHFNVGFWKYHLLGSGSDFAHSSTIRHHTWARPTIEGENTDQIDYNKESPLRSAGWDWPWAATHRVLPPRKRAKPQTQEDVEKEGS